MERYRLQFHADENGARAQAEAWGKPQSKHRLVCGPLNGQEFGIFLVDAAGNLSGGTTHRNRWLVIGELK